MEALPFTYGTGKITNNYLVRLGCVAVSLQAIDFNAYYKNMIFCNLLNFQSVKLKWQHPLINRTFSYPLDRLL